MNQPDLDRIRIIAVVLTGVTLVTALVPEFPRYHAERRLYAADALFRSLLADGDAAAQQTAILDAVAVLATQAANSLADDSRPFILAGSARLVERRPDEALALYRRALAVGERAEIDLNLGRAHALGGNQPAASAAVLRAVWVSPALLSALPEQVRAPLRAAIADETQRLTNHRLATPPTLPAADRSE